MQREAQQAAEAARLAALEAQQAAQAARLAALEVQQAALQEESAAATHQLVGRDYIIGELLECQGQQQQLQAAAAEKLQERVAFLEATQAAAQQLQERVATLEATQAAAQQLQERVRALEAGGATSRAAAQQLAGRVASLETSRGASKATVRQLQDQVEGVSREVKRTQRELRLARADLAAAGREAEGVARALTLVTDQAARLDTSKAELAALVKGLQASSEDLAEQVGELWLERDALAGSVNWLLASDQPCLELEGSPQQLAGSQAEQLLVLGAPVALAGAGDDAVGGGAGVPAGPPRLVLDYSTPDAADEAGGADDVSLCGFGSPTSLGSPGGDGRRRSSSPLALEGKGDADSPVRAAPVAVCGCNTPAWRRGFDQV